jgi:radial spoke head protein 4A
MTLDEAKAFLQKEGKDGSTAYMHLAEVVLKIINEKPSESHELIEHISDNLKQTIATRRTKVPQGGESGEQAEAAATLKQNQWVEKSHAIIKDFMPPKNEEDETPRHPAEGQEDVPTQDLLTDAEYLEWAGVSIGKEETYRMHLSLKKLASLTNAAPAEVGADIGRPVYALRFWGKVAGIQADYYIAEGVIEDEEEFDEEAQGKKMEVGPNSNNRFTYWVCSYPGCPDNEWTKLPKVEMAQIVTARKLKKFFTGNLKSPVQGYPPFPGNEMNLLRAQISIISSETCLCPVGLYEASGDEPAEIEPKSEDFEKFDAKRHGKLSGFLHLHHEINTLGRCTEMPENEDEEAPKDPRDVIKPIMEPISKDEGADKCWRVKPGDGYSVVKNLCFPGAVCVAWPDPNPTKPAKFCNIYIGYGLAHTDKAYTPPCPPPIGREYVAPEGTAESDYGKLCIEHTDKDIKVDPAPPADEEEEEE